MKILNEQLDISSLLRAQAFLLRVLETAKNEAEKAGAIKAFECSYELSWKTMKRILGYRGIVVNSPRETFRTAGKEGLIADAELWFNFIDQRNETVHTYDEVMANDIFEELPKFANLLNDFAATIKKL